MDDDESEIIVRALPARPRQRHALMLIFSGAAR